MVRTSFVQRRVRRGRTLKAILDPIVVAQAHREPPSPGRPAFGGYGWWAEGPELVDNLLLLQPALPQPRNKTISYPLHILGVPL